MSALFDFLYEQAEKSLNRVDPVPPAPNSSACVPGGAQDNNTESAGSPPLPTVYPEVK